MAACSLSEPLSDGARGRASARTKWIMLPATCARVDEAHTAVFERCDPEDRWLGG